LIEPNDSSGEVYCGEEIPGGFVVTVGDDAELLEQTGGVLERLFRPARSAGARRRARLETLVVETLVTAQSVRTLPSASRGK